MKNKIRQVFEEIENIKIDAPDGLKIPNFWTELQFWIEFYKIKERMLNEDTL